MTDVKIQERDAKVYPMDKSVVVIFVICCLFSVGFAWAITVFRDDQLKYMALNHADFWDSSTVLTIGFFGSLSCAAALWAIHTFKIIFSKIVINPLGIERTEVLGKSVFIPWKEIGGLSERRKMQQLVVEDASRQKRILVDYQFTNFIEIEKRLFQEYQDLLVVPPLPIHFGKPLSGSPESPLYPLTVTRSAVSLRGKVDIEIPFSEIEKVGFEYVNGFDNYGNPSSQWSYVSLTTKSGKGYTLGRSLGSIPEIYVTLKKIIETTRV